MTAPTGSARPDDARTLVLGWPWWLHPVWVVVAFAGLTAVAAVAAPAGVYDTWGMPKFLTPGWSATLLLGIVALVVGLALSSWRLLGHRVTTFRVTPHQVTFLRHAYVVTFTLVLTGYLFWVVSAAARGVTLAHVVSVVTLDLGAVDRIRDIAVPIAGITTLTQVAPVTSALWALLFHLGQRPRGLVLVLALAAARALLYAERLALIEVLLPLALIWAAGRYSGRRPGRAGVFLLPVAALAGIWLLFAAYEYTRSWVFYRQTTSTGFAEWVTNRLLGYYTTSYNNSALFAESLEPYAVTPYYAFSFVWNAPFLESLLEPPSYGGRPVTQWFADLLINYSNPEFNNPGSFLPVAAELSTLGMVAYFLGLGVLSGHVYTRMREGSVPALLTYVTLFVALLELPRFLYVAEGRAVPVYLALGVIALRYHAHGTRVDGGDGDGAPPPPRPARTSRTSLPPHATRTPRTPRPAHLRSVP